MNEKSMLSAPPAEMEAEEAALLEHYHQAVASGHGFDVLVSLFCLCREMLCPFLVCA